MIDFGKLAEDSAIMDESHIEKNTEHSNFSMMVSKRLPEGENDQ